jgi:1-acyl-sn-glycerol-3-phosphate acyltransferase
VTAALPEDRTADTAAPTPTITLGPVPGHRKDETEGHPTRAAVGRPDPVSSPRPHRPGGHPADLPPGTWPHLHDLACWVGSWCFRPVLRVQVHHADRIPATGPVVLVANHSALVDGPLLFGLTGRRGVFLVKREMFRGPLAWLLPRIGQLPVGRAAADATSLRAAADVLRGGGLVGVFPEGTRGIGDVTAAQHGAAWLARATGAVVLPVAVRGTHRVPGTRRRVRPQVDVLVGPPLAVVPGAGRAGLTAATETVRAALAGLVVALDQVRSST